jgi:periplasmic protein TonB
MDRAEMFATNGAGSGRGSFGGAAPTSLLLHAIALSLLLIAPLWTNVASPKVARDAIGILTYDPPPPPAAPLPPGNGPVTRVVTRPQVRPEPVPAFVTPVIEPPIEAAPTTESVPDVLPGGSLKGIAEGTELGEEWGRKGGVVGGVPDGIEGGVPTGTGRYPLPVTGYQLAPVRLRMVQPVYPPDAFAKKIQGTVVLQILIGVDGRVLRATVTSGIPLLDAAAVEAVLQWRFRPAMKDGQPVPSLATAPVQFRIY